jgi:hypothetical protein
MNRTGNFQLTRPCRLNSPSLKAPLRSSFGGLVGADDGFAFSTTTKKHHVVLNDALMPLSSFGLLIPANFPVHTWVSAIEVNLSCVDSLGHVLVKWPQSLLLLGFGKSFNAPLLSTISQLRRLGYGVELMQKSWRMPQRTIEPFSVGLISSPWSTPLPTSA